MWMLLAGCSKDERLQAWYQSTSWVEMNLQKFVPRVFVKHSLSYTIAMVAIVNQLYINVDAPGRKFEPWTPPSLVPVNIHGGEKLTNICSKSVHRTQPDLHTSLPLQYTIAMAAIENKLNINVDAPGWKFERWMPPILVPVNFVCGVEHAKHCFMRVRKTQPALHTSLPFQYTLASKSIEYKFGCSCPDVRTMNASKLSTSQPPGLRGACKNLFQERSSNTAWATHQFASPIQYCYGS